MVCNLTGTGIRQIVVVVVGALVIAGALAYTNRKVPEPKVVDEKSPTPEVIAALSPVEDDDPLLEALGERVSRGELTSAEAGQLLDRTRVLRDDDDGYVPPALVEMLAELHRTGRLPSGAWRALFEEEHTIGIRANPAAFDGTLTLNCRIILRKQATRIIFPMRLEIRTVWLDGRDVTKQASRSGNSATVDLARLPWKLSPGSVEVKAEVVVQTTAQAWMVQSEPITVQLTDGPPPIPETPARLRGG